MRPLTHDAQYICRKLEITELEYCEKIEKDGHAYLRRKYPVDQLLRELHVSSSIFWKWWVNQWEIRDRDFVSSCMKFNPWPAHINRKLYQCFHEVSELTIQPNSLVIRDVSKSLRALAK